MADNTSTQNAETYDDGAPCRSLSTSVVPFSLSMQEFDGEISNEVEVPSMLCGSFGH